MSPEKVNHPPHYQQHPRGIEAIAVLEYLASFNLGNAIKYLFRETYKGVADEDRKKAAWYVLREIELLRRRDATPHSPIDGNTKAHSLVRRVLDAEPVGTSLFWLLLAALASRTINYEFFLNRAYRELTGAKV